VFIQLSDHVAMVDRDSRIPLSRQVAAILRVKILAGEYAPGQRLPSIADLVGEFGIARDTATKAQRLLIADGLAEQETGMGLYVADPLPPV
jgi:DNA-binding GntR family transcriptional regulator